MAQDGTRGPTVVLQSGLGDGMAPWADVYRALKDHDQRVFAYDRPGYGAHSPTPTSRSPCEVADELHGLLAASGQRPPYLLVGHSLGGLYQYVFARLYPDEVAGMVLLDPTHPDHWTAMQAEAPAAAQIIKTLRTTVFSATARQEFDDQQVCLSRFEAAPRFDFETRILVSTRFTPLDDAAFQRLLVRLRTDWLRLTGAASLQPVAGAGHYLQREAPGQVVQAIEAGVVAAKRR